MISNPLREEAERAWAQSARAAQKRGRKTGAIAHTESKRKRLAERKDRQIRSLKGKLKHARQELQQRRQTGPESSN